MPKRRYLLALALGMSAGCAEFTEFCDTGLVASRNQRLAQISWRDAGARCAEGKEHRKDFRAGYIAGYAGVAGGSRGCPPAVPPEEYWASCYQTACGHAQAMAWFAGYNEGVVAAQRDGINAIQSIPTWCGTNRNCGCEEPAQPQTQMAPVAPLPNGNSGIRVRANRLPDVGPLRPLPQAETKPMPPAQKKDKEDEEEPVKAAPPPKPMPPKQEVPAKDGKQAKPPAPMPPNNRLPLNPAAAQPSQDQDDGLPKPPPLLGSTALRPREPSRIPQALPPATTPSMREVPADEEEPGRKGSPPPVRRTVHQTSVADPASDDADWDPPADRKRRLAKFRDAAERGMRPAPKPEND